MGAIAFIQKKHGFLLLYLQSNYEITRGNTKISSYIYISWDRRQGRFTNKKEKSQYRHLLNFFVRLINTIYTCVCVYQKEKRSSYIRYTFALLGLKNLKLNIFEIKSILIVKEKPFHNVFYNYCCWQRSSNFLNFDNNN